MVRPCGRLSALPDGFQAARQGRRAASHSRSCRAAPGYRGEGPPLRLADPIPEKPICVTIGEALDFGPFFLKFCAYFPYNAKLCINGHEYLKRQLAKRRVAFEALDNGIKSCAEPQLLQRLSDGRTAEKIDRLLRKWLRRLPHPFHTFAGLQKENSRRRSTRQLSFWDCSFRGSGGYSGLRQAGGRRLR